MPLPSTMTPIATAVADGSSGAITFSSIPSTYTDLVVVISGRVSQTSGNNVSAFYFNGDTASNYSMTRITGDGSSASSDRTGSSFAGWCFVANSTVSEFTPIIYHIMNYSNTTTYKTVLGRGAAASSLVSAAVSMWRNTAAINSITVTHTDTNWVSGSTATLYGIKAA